MKVLLMSCFVVLENTDGPISLTGDLMRWIPPAIDEATARKVDPPLGEHEHRRDRGCKQGQEKAQGL